MFKKFRACVQACCRDDKVHRGRWPVFVFVWRHREARYPNVLKVSELAKPETRSCIVPAIQHEVLTAHEQGRLSNSLPWSDRVNVPYLFDKTECQPTLRLSLDQFIYKTLTFPGSSSITRLSACLALILFGVLIIWLTAAFGLALFGLLAILFTGAL